MLLLALWLAAAPPPADPAGATPVPAPGAPSTPPLAEPPGNVPPADAPPADAVPPLPLEGLPILVWSDGEVRARAGVGAPPQPPVLGDALDVGMSLELATNGRVALLAGGARLVVLRGPGYWRMARGALETVTGGAPRAELLAPYREGPLPTLEPVASQDAEWDLGLAATLDITSPAGPIVRLPPTEVRWHWPHAGGRFDLTITRVDADGRRTVVESWTNLAERRVALWGRLEQGADYHLAIALRTSAGASPAIVDTEVVHTLAPSELAAVEGTLAVLDQLLAASRRYRPEFDVLRARVLESHGLLADAQAVWTGLSILYPRRGELFQQALRLQRRTSD